MDLLRERLLELRAADVMTQDVVQVSSHANVGATANQLAECGHTSAPVVDEMGRCVGVVSAADFLYREQQRACLERAVMTQRAPALIGRAYPDDMTSIGPCDDDVVCHMMSRHVETVEESTPLVTVARRMLASGLHRLYVLDLSGRVAGVVSISDVLRGLTHEISVTPT
jgi:CBS-domain-containing membrane protein